MAVGGSGTGGVGVSKTKYDDLPVLVDAQAKEAGFDKPLREHRFCPIRRWRCDYFWPYAVNTASGFRHDVALEVEGGIWTGGRHTRGAGFLKDCEKYNTMANLGIRLIRLTPAQVRKGELTKWLRSMA
jgi:hypothetical protein